MIRQVMDFGGMVDLMTIADLGCTPSDAIHRCFNTSCIPE